MGITGRGRDDEKTKDGTEERKKEQQLYGLNPRKKNIKEDQRKENDNPNLKNKLRQCVTSVDANKYNNLDTIIYSVSLHK
jgi:hypothetical protein